MNPFKPNVDSGMAIKVSEDQVFVVTGGLSNYVAKLLQEIFPLDPIPGQNPEKTIAMESVAMDVSEQSGLWDALSQSDDIADQTNVNGILSFDVTTCALSDYVRITTALEQFALRGNLHVVALGDMQNANPWAQSLIAQLQEQGVNITYGEPDRDTVIGWTGVSTP